ncbi:hypothetical protein BKA70DRAFT_1236444 [Coprinopsis sp. MPI-PUGE-AT-0042]|nr:hypothetical protein BKA70DRAFT_1236444 [Coprinopsis sp. MPI-PUGE-AT-0042]
MLCDESWLSVLAIVLVFIPQPPRQDLCAVKATLVMVFVQPILDSSRKLEWFSASILGAVLGELVDALESADPFVACTRGESRLTPPRMRDRKRSEAVVHRREGFRKGEGERRRYLSSHALSESHRNSEDDFEMGSPEKQYFATAACFTAYGIQEETKKRSEWCMGVGSGKSGMTVGW